MRYSSFTSIKFQYHFLQMMVFLIYYKWWDRLGGILAPIKNNLLFGGRKRFKLSLSPSPPTTIKSLSSRTDTQLFETVIIQFFPDDTYICTDIATYFLYLSFHYWLQIVNRAKSNGGVYGYWLVRKIPLQRIIALKVDRAG